MSPPSPKYATGFPNEQTFLYSLFNRRGKSANTHHTSPRKMNGTSEWKRQRLSSGVSPFLGQKITESA